MGTYVIIAGIWVVIIYDYMVVIILNIGSIPYVRYMVVIKEGYWHLSYGIYVVTIQTICGSYHRGMCVVIIAEFGSYHIEDKWVITQGILSSY